MSPEKQLAGFIAKFTPQMARFIRAARKKVRALVPNAHELVYDNYNFFVIAYSPTERSSDAVLSLAAFARGINLFFANGTELPDPKGVLVGSGKKFRSVPLEDARDLDRAEVRALVKAATKGLPAARHRLIIKAISEKQRPRRK